MINWVRTSRLSTTRSLSLGLRVSPELDQGELRSVREVLGVLREDRQQNALVLALDSLQWNEEVDISLQDYPAHGNLLRQPYAQEPVAILGGWVSLMSEVPLSGAI